MEFLRSNLRTPHDCARLLSVSAEHGSEWLRAEHSQSLPAGCVWTTRRFGWLWDCDWGAVCANPTTVHVGPMLTVLANGRHGLSCRIAPADFKGIMSVASEPRGQRGQRTPHFLDHEVQRGQGHRISDNWIGGYYSILAEIALENIILGRHCRNIG